MVSEIRGVNNRVCGVRLRHIRNAGELMIFCRVRLCCFRNTREMIKVIVESGSALSELRVNEKSVLSQAPPF